MLYVFAFIGVFVFVIAILIFAQGRTGADKATLERIESILASPGAVADDESILVEASRGTWVDRVLGNASIIQHIGTLIDQAGWTISADLFLLWSVGAGFVGFVLAWLFWPGVPYEIATFAGFTFLPYFYLRYKRTKRLLAFDKNLPDTIDMIQGLLKAGVARQAALERAASRAKEPVRSEMTIVVNRLLRGADERTEFISLANRVPTPDLRIFVTAMLIVKETGGSTFPEVLARLTTMMRVRSRLVGEMKAKTAQGRMSGWFLAMIPLFMVGIMKMVNPAYLDPLFNEPRGRYMLVYSVISDIVGTLFIRHITRMEV
jgi:tight adherence protein B